MGRCWKAGPAHASTVVGNDNQGLSGCDARAHARARGRKDMSRGTRDKGSTIRERGGDERRRWGRPSAADARQEGARRPPASRDLVTRPSLKAFYRATFVLYIKPFLTCPCIVPIQARCLFGSGCVPMPYLVLSAAPFGSCKRLPLPNLVTAGCQIRQQYRFQLLY